MYERGKGLLFWPGFGLSGREVWLKESILTSCITGVPDVMDGIVQGRKAFGVI
jgi:hypothetical protein